MATTDKTVILDIEVNVGDSINQLAKINEQLVELQQQKKDLDKVMKDGTATKEQIQQYSEITAAIKTLNRSRAAEMKEIYQEAQQYRYAADTIQGMSDRLRQMKDEYVKMSAEMRNSPAGKQLALDIRETTTALNVMKNEMQPSFIEKFNAKVIGLTASFNRFPKTFSGLKTGLATITSAFKVLFKTIIMNPIGLLITAITSVILICRKFFKETEAGQRIMQTFGGTVDTISEGLKMMVNGIATAVEWLLKLIPSYRKASEEAENYAGAIEQIRQREEALEKQKEKNLDLNEREKKKIMDNTRSYEVRVGILDTYLERNREILKTERDIAQQTVEDLGIRQKLSEEDQKRLADARLILKTYDNRVKLLEKEGETLYRVINTDQTKARQTAEEEAKKSNDKILEGLKKTKEELTSIWKDIYLSQREAEIDALEETYQHNVDIINKAVKDEAEKNQMLLDLTKKYREDVAAVNKKYDDEEQARLAKENADKLSKEETLRQLKAQEATLKQMELDNQALFNAREKETSKTAVVLEQSQRRIEIAKQEAERIKNLSKEQIEAQYGEGEIGIQKWKNAQIEANNAVSDATRQNVLAQEDFQKALKEAQLETIANFQTILGGLSSLTSAFSGLFNNLAEDNEEFQKYANVLAYINIMINMAEAIAGAIAQAQSVPFPANIAAMATGVAAVVSGIAEAVSIQKKNKSVPNSPKFASGGLVGDRTTTRTDDTISAKLSEGEYVIRSSVVKSLGVDFFNRINGSKGDRTNRFSSGGVVPSMATISKTDAFNYEQMKNMFVEAVSGIHPEVSVKEINRVQTQVQVKENISTI